MEADRRAEVFARELAHAPRYALATVLAQAAETAAATEGIPYRDAHAHVRRLVSAAKGARGGRLGSRRIGRALTSLLELQESAREVIRRGCFPLLEGEVEESKAQLVRRFERVLDQLTPLSTGRGEA